MIENLLNEEGRGVLTAELSTFFSQSGCKPSCHICRKFIEVNEEFRLKPFCAERNPQKGKEAKSLAIMVCRKCDTQNKKLPYPEFFKAMHSLGFNVPEHAEKVPNKRGIKQQGRVSFWDSFYYKAIGTYERAKKRFQSRYEQFLEEETYAEYCAREARNHARWAAAQKPRGGCFVLSEGSNRTVISNR